MEKANNIINVSNKGKVNFFVNLGRTRLHDQPPQGIIYLHAIGNAITTCVITAHHLEEFGYGNITKITSETKEVESRGDQQKTKKAKLIIEMTKSEKFEEHYKKYEEIRAQNQSEKQEAAK